jgi:hypothetical protein
MSKAIVMNTLTGAVSEYDNFEFQSITPTHAGSATGLFSLGGSTDLGALIVAEVMTGKTLFGPSVKKFVDLVYFAMRGSGISALLVQGAVAAYAYTFPVRASGESRAKPGRGIRENYLAFGYTNTDGADFRLDRIEVSVIPAETRRV